MKCYLATYRESFSWSNDQIGGEVLTATAAVIAESIADAQAAVEAECSRPQHRLIEILKIELVAAKVLDAGANVDTTISSITCEIDPSFRSFLTTPDE
jgi:hypothetical protein